VEDLAVELRTEQECDVVLVASHGDDYSLNNTMLMYEGAARIDGIFTGHTHTPTKDEAMRADGTKVYILQNGGYGQSFASLALKFDENGNLQSTEGRLNYTSNYTSDGTLDAVFDKYAEYISIGSEVVLTAEEEMSRYDVGNYVAYSMYQKYGVDFAIINSGGVRASISAGEVTYADLFQVLPFENEVYIVTLSGAEINEYINSASVYWWGLYNLEDEQNYQLAIIDFVYLSDNFAAYRKDDYIDTNDLIRDVFIDFIKAAI
jgi:2',3'-cyclic-nucleotide 2'-phosphodiesterase (5'-nucleotidase family)